MWLESCEAAGLERTTITAYRQHVDLHIVPILGALRLSQFTVPLVRGFPRGDDDAELAAEKALG